MEQFNVILRAPWKY